MNIIEPISKYLYKILVYGSLILLLAIGVYYTITLFRGYDRDTTNITNAAFVISASLSALCFTYLSSITKDNQDEQKRIRYSGESFFRTSLYLIIASLIKYPLYELNSKNLGNVGNTVIDIVSYPISFFTAILFLWAILEAHGAIRVIFYILEKRRAVIKDWDSIM